MRLTTAIGFNGRFAWSPDGHTIALARDVAGESDLYRVNTDGSGIVRLTSGRRRHWRVRLVVRQHAHRVRLRGRSLRDQCRRDGVPRLTTSSGRSAVFAPGDGRIAFVTTSFGPAAEIAVRNEDGTIVRVAPGTQAPIPSGHRTGPACCLKARTRSATKDAVQRVQRRHMHTGLRSLLGECGRLEPAVAREGQQSGLVAPASRPAARILHAPVRRFQLRIRRRQIIRSGWHDRQLRMAAGRETTGTGATITHAYLQGGTFTVTLTVTETMASRAP